MGTNYNPSVSMNIFLNNRIITPTFKTPDDEDANNFVNFISFLFTYTCIYIGTFSHSLYTHLQARRNKHIQTHIYIKLSLSHVVNSVEGLKIHRVSTNILNKQSRIADRRLFFSWRTARVVNKCPP